MRFRIKGVREGEALGQFEIEAANAATAREAAVRQGWRVLSATPVLAFSFNSLSRPAQFSLLSFAQELLALLEGGLGLIEALATLARKERREEIRGLLEDILSALRRGEPFSAALARHPARFPGIFTASVQAAEHTSNLREALGRYIAYAEQFNRVRDRVASALVYPAVLLGVGTLVVAFLVFYVMPRFARVYEGFRGDLPFFSSLLLGFGQAIDRHAPLVGGLALLAVGGLAIALRREDVRRRLGQRLLESNWLHERFMLMQQARLYRTLGMLLRGGLPVVQAGAMVAPLLDANSRARLDRALGAVGEGKAISASFEAAGLASPVALSLLAVGEKSGRMGEAMERIAAFHDEEMGRWIERFVRLFEPLLMAALGLVVGLIVVMMYMPIFELAGAVH